MDHQLRQLQDWISESRHIIFLGGAGASTEGGIPDFRGVDGLYHQQYAFSPEMILSHSSSRRNPEGFYRFHHSKMFSPQARPNATHWKLAKLKAVEKLIAVTTQNINGLYQAAGNKTVYELHGSAHQNHCMKCRWFYDLDFLLETSGVPRCPTRGGVVKPSVVLYEECLGETTMMGAVEVVAGAGILVIDGISLMMCPAVGSIRYHRGSRLALINKSAIPYDREADLIINASLDKVLGVIRI